MEIFIQILLLAFGLIILTKGADLFVDGAADMAAKLYIPEIIIGLTVVSMGTTAPEAAISISAALKGTADISIGNVIGSNILNILLILGLTAAIKAMSISPFAVKVELPYVIFIFALLIGLGSDGSIDAADGVILWVGFIAYLAYLFIIARREHYHMPSSNNDNISDKSDEDTHLSQNSGDRAFIVVLALTLLGLAVIIAGSNIAVDAATVLAHHLGLSERFIGLTIIAVGTSLPELVTCVTAAIKGSPDIAFGNIVGSCIFNALFVLGTSALIKPIAFSAELFPDALAALAAALLLFLLCFPSKKLNRPAGITMLAGYILYFIFVLL